MKLNLASGSHPLNDFVNLDKETGWLFENGLRIYKDGKIDAITESHGLMYVPLEKWGFVFGEFARVLKPGGVIRITEDATDDPKSERYGGFDGAVTLTSAGLVCAHLLMAGLEPTILGPDETLYSDTSLLQQFHGASPKVFFCEGVKP